MNLRRLWAFILKELRQLRRDRMTVGMIIGIPTLQLMMFGYAINLDVRGLPAAVVDQAGTRAARVVVADLVATGVVVPVLEARSPAEVEAALRDGEVSVGIVVPPDFDRRVAEGREALQVMVDGSDTSVQNAVRQLAQMPLGGASLSGQQVSVLPLYNPSRRSPVNVVPGLIGVILSMTMILFTAVSLVRERERGNLEFIITTPVTRLELMLGKVLPYVGIGLLQTTLVLWLGMSVFGVPVHGSLVAVYAAALLLIAANLTLGLLISTRAQTQFQGAQMSFFLLLPSILISGFVFPFAGMPRPAQWVAELLPMTHFLRIIRGVMLRGAEFAELWPEAAVLFGFTVVMMVLAVTRFRKSLD